MVYSRFIALACGVCLVSSAMGTLGVAPPARDTPQADDVVTADSAERSAERVGAVIKIDDEGVATIIQADPDAPAPFVVGDGTRVRQVIGEAGTIVYAFENADRGAKPANLQTVGTPRVDGSLRDAGASIAWAETVELGAFRNAGHAAATVVFSSGKVINIQPGEVIFASATMSAESLKSAMLEGGWVCCCHCECSCAGAPDIWIECARVPGGDCAGMEQNQCQDGLCTGTISNCMTVFVHGQECPNE